MMDKNFDQDLIKKIKEEKIAPTPRWKFIFKNYIIWIIGAICLFIGATAVSLTIHMVRYNDLGIYRRLGHLRPLEFFLLSVPLFWLILLAAFISLLYYDIKHTKKGYRYGAPKILLATISISAIMGIGFYYCGLGEKIDDILGERAPFYDRIINPKIHFWSNPDEGRLSGLIISQVNEDKFILIDKSKNEWEFLTKNAKKDPGFELIINQPVRSLGQQISARQFQAAEIFPVHSGRSFFNQFGRRNPLFPPNHCGINDMTNFSILLEKYPNLKQSFSQGLLDNKDQIQGDLELLNYFEQLNFDTSAIKQLK